jgi:hypothetical protein
MKKHTNKQAQWAVFMMAALATYAVLSGPSIAEDHGGNKPVPAGGDFEIPWSTIDGGGGTSSGDSFEMSGTAGQPDAGVMSGGDFELTGGFWFKVAAGDCNFDGNVGLFDFDDFADCVTGSGGGPPVGDCACFDFEPDGDVDLIDFSELQTAFGG